MDNFYCDPHLFLELERKWILACGTIRENCKGFPKDIVLTSAMERTMNHGDYLWRNHGSLVAMAWCDKCTVYLVSTIHPPDINDEPAVVEWCNAAEGHEAIPCPPAQPAYQEFMGGVDLADQILHSFTVIRRSSKAWKKLFYYGLEACLLNSFIIFKKVKLHPVEFLCYRLAVVRHLLEGTCLRGQPGHVPTRPLADVDAQRLNRQ